MEKVQAIRSEVMRFQWTLIWGLFFTLLVAVFAVANVAPVTVNYLLGFTEIPLILVIVGSALLGGLVVGMFGIFRQYKLQWKVKKLEKELESYKSKEVSLQDAKPSIIEAPQQWEEENASQAHKNEEEGSSGKQE